MHAKHQPWSRTRTVMTQVVASLACSPLAEASSSRRDASAASAGAKQSAPLPFRSHRTSFCVAASSIFQLYTFIYCNKPCLLRVCRGFIWAICLCTKQRNASSKNVKRNNRIDTCLPGKKAHTYDLSSKFLWLDIMCLQQFRIEP